MDGMKPSGNGGSSTDFGVGIPTSFTKQTGTARTFLIRKGQLNHYRLRPAIVNEHVETARESQAVVSSGNHVGQIFKASQDNINGITLTLESAAGAVFDDFESYADSTALQVEWDETDAADPATLEQTIVYQGVKAMKLPGDATAGDEWWKTFVSTNFTGYFGEFHLQASHTYAQLKLRVFVEDSSGNTSSAPLPHQDTEVWEHFEIDINSLAADVVTPADLTDIIKIGLRLEDRRTAGEFFIDCMVSTPPPGSVELELWDMGDTLPTTGVTSIDDGTQYDELGDRGVNSGVVAASVSLEMIGGKRQYTVGQFIAGVALEIPDNTVLTVGNYYAVVIKYVDTDVTVYGANTTFATNYYQSGFAFTAPSDAAAITAIGAYNDIQFGIFSTQDVYLNTLLKFYEDSNGDPASPGANASETVYIEDLNMHIQGIIAGENKPQQTLFAEFKDRVFQFNKGGKFEVNQNDDYLDDTYQITILIGYIFEPPTMNG